KNHRLLTNTEEPATAKLGNEVHALKPLNHLVDEPDTRKSLARIAELCAEGRDWVNIVPFLTELKVSGRKVKGWQFEKIVRKMGEKGGMGVIMEMARRVEGTGMRLGDIAVTREIMWGALLKCLRSECRLESVQEAEKFIEAVWLMLSDERHVDRNAMGKDNGDPKRRPEIVGVLLWIRALGSTLFGESKDVDGKVKRAAELLLATWPQKTKAVATPFVIDDEESWYRANDKLTAWSPVWHGMKMARKIVGENTALGRDLANTVALDLEPMLKNARQVVARHVGEEDRARRGVVVFDGLEKMAAGG
ncbi:MAG: hypothetical protein Q9168_007719, partial [Polycauliona sp. 1 TL-2023]